ncbi:MAG TPA: hypothetical protein VG722_08260 [Tepidisphaeraceae bacterium]|nr:hypothetical protein [Tepidisphaeraceae bacterium]
MNQNWLLLSVLYGALGMGFFIYGKKQQRPVPLIVGIVLMLVTFFVYNTTRLVVIGAALVALTWVLRDK